MGESDGVAKDADWAARDHRRSPPETIRALARRMAADAHDADRVVVAAARRPRRAALLGARPARSVARPDRAAGRRGRVRLWLVGQHRRAAAALSRPGDGSGCAILPGSPFRRRASPTACCIPARATTTTAGARHIPTSGWSIGRAAIRSIITRTSTACAAPGSGPKPSSCTSRGGLRPRATPTSCCRRRRRSSATTSAAPRATASSSRCSRRSRPVGEARDDFAIFARAGAAPGLRRGVHRGPRRDGMAAPHLGRVPRAARSSNDGAGFRSSSGATGLARNPAAERGSRAASPSSAPIPRRIASTTPSGRIELYSERIAGFGYDDCPPHPAWIEPAEWLGARDGRGFPAPSRLEPAALRLHSQMDPGPVSALGKVGGREAIAHPSRRRARPRHRRRRRGARLQRPRRVPMPARSLTDAVRRAWCGSPAVPGTIPSMTARRRACAHGNANVLTRDQGTSRLGQGPSSATALVEIERADDAPQVRAFAPPSIA